MTCRHCDIHGPLSGGRLWLWVVSWVSVRGSVSKRIVHPSVRGGRVDGWLFAWWLWLVVDGVLKACPQSLFGRRVGCCDWSGGRLSWVVYRRSATISGSSSSCEWCGRHCGDFLVDDDDDNNAVQSARAAMLRPI